MSLVTGLAILLAASPAPAALVGGSRGGSPSQANTVYDSETFSAVMPGPGLCAEADPLEVRDPVAGEGTWTGSGPWGGNIRALATAVGDAGTVVAGCGYSMAPDAGGAWRSTDGGATWQATNLQGIQVNSVCNGGSARPDCFYASTRTGLYLSQDLGQTWSVLAGGMSSAYVLAVGPHWTDPDILIAGLSSNQGIRRSADGGATWSEVGLSTGFMKGYGFCPGHPDTMYVAMSGISDAVYRSTNAGLTWIAVGPSGSGWGLLAAPGGVEGRVVATVDGGFYLSNNYGISWSQVVSGSSYAPAAAGGGVIYAPVIGTGVYESSDGGSNWTLNTQGVVESYWQAGCCSSAGYLAGHRGGIYRQAAPGGVFLVSQQGISNGFIHAVSYLAGQNALLAAGEAHGMWKSTDGGATWQMSATGLTNWTIFDLWPESNDQYMGPTVYAATQSGVFRSDDWGASWSAAGLSGAQITAVAFDPDDPDHAWAGTATAGVRYTADGGANWLSSSGLPSALYPVIELAETAGGDLRVLVSFQQSGPSVYRSDDGGVTFTQGSGVSGSYMPCLSYRWGSDDAFCGTDGGVYRSGDRGATWEACPGSSGLTWSVLGSRNANVLAGTGSAGVKWSPDGGDTWQPLNDGIETRCVWDIVYGASDNQLFAGLRGFGVVELTSDELGISGDGSTGRPLELSVFPNPSAGVVSVIMQPSGPGPVDLEVFDSAGRLIYGASGDPGSPMSWDTEACHAPAGVYLVRAASGDASAVARVIVLGGRD